MLTVCYVRADGSEGLYRGWFIGPETEGPNGPRRKFKTMEGEYRTLLLCWITRVIEDGRIVYGDRPQPRKGGKFAKA